MSLGLSLKCPKCNKGKVYSSFLKIADKCNECGFSLKERDSADGPAYVSMCIVAPIVIILSFYVENKYQPEAWVHAALWIPFVFTLSIICLIFTKSLFITLEYKYNILGFADKNNGDSD